MVDQVVINIVEERGAELKGILYEVDSPDVESDEPDESDEFDESDDSNDSNDPTWAPPKRRRQRM